jgi:hypothetical protein
MWESLALLMTGFVTGSLAAWAALRSIRRKARALEAYYRERIEAQLKEVLANMSRKPELVIKGSHKADRVRYCCSQCGWEFALANDVTPRQAVAELIRRFAEHCEREHPSPSSPEPDDTVPE